MKITKCPPGYAIGYENSASIVNGFFSFRFGGIASHRHHYNKTIKISETHALKLGSAFSLSDVIGVNIGKSK